MATAASAGATAEALAVVTGELFDRSDALFAELKRFVPAAEAHSASIHGVLRASTAAVAAYPAEPSAAGVSATALTDSIASCTAANAALADFAVRSDSQLAARVAQSEEQERVIEADCDVFSKEMAAKRRAVDAAHQTAVKAIMATHGLAA